MFRAHDPIEGRLVALKLFRLDLPPEQTADFAAALEDVVSQQPQHPTIAAAIAAGVEGRQAYLAQEYVVGDSLDAVIRQSGRPAIDATLVTLGRLAEALDRAAGEGIHHGALHLRDVLMEDGAPRLIDVGVAQALEHAGLHAPVRIPYSAPERVEERPWGGPADIFALGAIAFELVTGRRIVGPGAPSLWAETVPGADVNALSDVFSRALAIEPGARFASASDLVDALRPILARTQALPSIVAIAADVPGEPLPSFLSPGESHADEAIREHDDDISADLPLIASAGGAPMFEVAADDRPGFFPPRDTSGDNDEHVGPYLDGAPPTRSAAPVLSGPLWTTPPPGCWPGPAPVPRADHRADRRHRRWLRVGLLDGVAHCRARYDCRGSRARVTRARRDVTNGIVAAASACGGTERRRGGQVATAVERAPASGALCGGDCGQAAECASRGSQAGGCRGRGAARRATDQAGVADPGGDHGIAARRFATGGRHRYRGRAVDWRDPGDARGPLAW